MSVLAAVQHDKNFKIFYERLKSNGKHTTSAQIAVMHKILLNIMRILTLKKYPEYNKF